MIEIAKLRPYTDITMKGRSLVTLDSLDNSHCWFRFADDPRCVSSRIGPLAHASRVTVPFQPENWLARYYYVFGPYRVDHVYDPQKTLRQLFLKKRFGAQFSRFFRFN